MDKENYTGPTSTANSSKDGRLKVDATQKLKKRKLKKIIRKVC